MEQKLIKANEAVVKAAILAGCRSFYGYPITPASELTEAAANLMPKIGGTFVQAESETAAINMVFGAAAAGELTMTASSGPGLSLMQEGISYLAGAELPCVIADIMRGGPGLGNIGPEQGDYNQMVKGGGHGNYHTIVYAPAYAQEMCDFTLKAFAAAQAYRTPAILLADGFVGQMMEPVRFPETAFEPPRPDWAVRGDAATRPNLITSIYMSHEDLEAHNRRLMAKYARATAALPEHREYLLEDTEVLLVGYGIVGRVLRSVVDLARREGIKAGLFRPVTLWPFPEAALAAATARAKRVLVVELSDGQLVHDVRLAAGCRLPIGFYGRQGGMVPTPNEILEVLRGTRKEHHVYG